MFQYLRVFALFAVMFALALPLSATAQEATAPEETVDTTALETPEGINAVVARMSDDEVRSFLIERLEAGTPDETAPPKQASIIDRVVALWSAFTVPLSSAVVALPNLVPIQISGWANVVDSFGGGGGFLTMLGLTALILAVSYGIEKAALRYAIRIKEPVLDPESDGLWPSLKYLFWRFLREVVGLIVFYIAITLMGRALLSPQQLSFAGPLVGYLIWMPRISAAFLRVLLAPNRPKLRLVNVNDKWSAFLYRQFIGLVFIGGLTLFLVAIDISFDIRLAEARLAYWVDCMVYGVLIYTGWRARDGLVEMMRGTDPDRTQFDERVARAYPYYWIAVAAGMWVIVAILIGQQNAAALSNGAHYTTMFWLLALPIIDTAIRGLVRHLVPPMQGHGPTAEKAYRLTKRSYVRIGRVISAGLVLMLIAKAWGLSLLDLTRDTVGFGDNLFGFLLTLVVGYVVYEGASVWINRQLAAEQTLLQDSAETDAGEIGGAGGSRMSTVLPLLLVTAHSAIIVVFGLLAIGNLGIDITPLLAGAGVLGLAIGFGAQKLVADVVSGVFFLIDDAFRVGEYVEIDGTMGSVEKISIRSMQLRHHRGAVHTIPYGEIPKLTNYSRDWVIMKLMFTVPFDTEPNKVKKIFKKIGAEMMEDPLFKDDFLEPFKSQGVFQFDDVGIVMRGKFTAKPGKQFMIRKEIYNKVRTEFEANGIEFARREVRVAIPGMEDHHDMTDEEKSAIGAAASGAVQQQLDEQAAAKK